jgi:predicted Zn-dependent peptidase
MNIEDVVKRIPLDNGTTILLFHKQNSLLLAITIAFPLMGANLYSANRAVAYLLANGWIKQLQSFLSQFGATARSVVSHDCVGIEIEMLPKYSQQSLAHLPHLLKKLCFSQEFLEETRTETLRHLQKEQHRPFYQGLHFIQKAIFAPDEAYSLSNMDYITATQRCTYRDVDQLQDYVDHAPLIISLCGNVAENLLDPVVQQLEKRPSTQHRSTPGSDITPFRPAVRSLKHYIPGQQALYMLGLPGVTLASEDKFPIHVIWSMLGGKDGRLDKQLRIERALSYSFTVYSREFVKGGYILFHMYCEPKHIKDVALIIQENLCELSNDNFSETEVQYAQQRLVNEFLLNTQNCRTIASRACVYEIACMEPLSMMHYPNRVKSISREAMRRAAMTYFQVERMVELAMYPQSAEEKQREKASSDFFHL